VIVLPVMVEPFERKTIGFENPGGLDRGEEAWGAQPLEQQALGTRLQGASILGRRLGVTDQGLKARLRAGVWGGGGALRGVSPEGVVPGGGLVPWLDKSIGSSSSPPEAWVI
jgi:hypothetical protein